MRRVALLALLALLTAAPARADVLLWTDGNGVQHFGPSTPGTGAIPPAAIQQSPSLYADFATQIYAATIGGQQYGMPQTSVLWAAGPPTGAYYIDPSATMRNSVPNGPRFTFDPVSNRSIGLLVEPAVATNYVPDPMLYTTGWGGGADSQGAINATLPAFVPGAAIIRHLRDTNPTPTAGVWTIPLPGTIFTYTHSTWVYIPKGSTAYSFCIGTSGTGISTTSVCANMNLTNVWQLVSGPISASASGTSLVLATKVVGPAGAIGYSTAPAVTALQYSSSFTPTARAGDVAVGSGLGLEQLGSGSGTLVLKGFARDAAHFASTVSGGIRVSDGTTANAVTLQVVGDPVQPFLQAIVASAGSTVLTQTGGAMQPGQFYTMALSWGAGTLTYADSLGGVASVTAAAPIGLKALTALAGPNPIAQISFIPNAMTPAALQALVGTGLSANVSVDAAHPGLTVPTNFVGVSFEENDSLQQLQFTGASGASLAALLNRLGPAGVLRIGGTSSDGVGWSASPTQVATLGTFMSSIPGWGLIFGLNLCANAPSAQATVAQNMAAAFPAVILQFGNEPDIYQTSCARATVNYGPADYLTDWAAYLTAVRAVAPTTALAGPDLGQTSVWLPLFLAGEATNVVLATRHFYPFCTSALATTPTLLMSDALYPTPSASPTTATAASDVAIAASFGLPVRMTESNSICVGGTNGVSNTLAAAIWAVEYIAQIENAGFAGVNFHGTRSAGTFYTPFVQQGDLTFLPQPVYYGMLLAAQVSGMRVLPVTSTVSTLTLPAFGFLGADGKARLMVVNKNLTQTASVNLTQGGGGGTWTTQGVLTLTGASAAATSVTLGGSLVDNAGSWSPVLTFVPRGVAVSVPPASAALITMQ